MKLSQRSIFSSTQQIQQICLLLTDQKYVFSMYILVKIAPPFSILLHTFDMPLALKYRVQFFLISMPIINILAVY